MYRRPAARRFGARRVFPVAANGAGIGEGGIGAGGDALFPALALTPRAAILATAYSAFPALLIGYGWYFLFE